MAPQLVADYAIDHPIGVAGSPAKMTGLQIGSVLAEVAIPVGRVVARSDTATKTAQGIIPDTTGAFIFGISMRDLSKQVPADQLLDYAAGDDVAIIQSGWAYAVPEEDVLPGQPVFVRHASGSGGTLLGALRNDADTADAYAWTVATWESTTAEGAVGVIFISSRFGA
jgi:hypothetical protein